MRLINIVVAIVSIVLVVHGLTTNRSLASSDGEIGLSKETRAEMDQPPTKLERAIYVGFALLLFFSAIFGWIVSN